MPRPRGAAAAAAGAGKQRRGGGKFARAKQQRNQNPQPQQPPAPHHQGYQQEYAYPNQPYAQDYYSQGYPQQAYHEYYPAQSYQSTNQAYYADDRYGYDRAQYYEYDQQQDWRHGGGADQVRWGDEGYAHPYASGGRYSAQSAQLRPHAQSVDSATPSAPKAMRQGLQSAHNPAPPYQETYNTHASSSSSTYAHPYRRAPAPPPSNIAPPAGAPAGAPKAPSSFRLAPAIRAAPRPDYLETAAQEPKKLSEDEVKDRQLLVILDLNGTLVFRAKSGNGRAIDSVRAVPRPFLLCFLQYCLGTSPTPTSLSSSDESQEKTQSSETGTATKPPHGSHFWTDASSPPVSSGKAQVVVWSSAQPNNVDSMVRASFDPSVRAQILRVWARDTLVTQRFFQSKAESIKDLEIVWAELNAHANDLPSPGRLMAEVRDKLDQAQPDHADDAGPVSAALEAARHAKQLGPWGQENTVLVDDSVAKARLQPHNHLLIPEFGKKQAEAMRKFIRQQVRQTSTTAAVEEEEEEEEEEEGEGDEEELEYDSDLSIGDETKGGAADEIDGKKEKKRIPETRLDDVLLQTIGVLETLRHQANVSAFIRAGGIKGYGEDKTHLNDKQKKEREQEANTPEYWSRLGRETCETLGIEVRAWKQREAANATAALLV